MTRATRPISWVSAARKAFERFPAGAQEICLTALTVAAEGGKADSQAIEGFWSWRYRDRARISCQCLSGRVRPSDWL